MTVFVFTEVQSNIQIKYFWYLEEGVALNLRKLVSGKCFTQTKGVHLIIFLREKDKKLDVRSL